MWGEKMHGLRTLKSMNQVKTWTRIETKKCGCKIECYGFKSDSGNGQGYKEIGYCILHDEEKRLEQRLKEIKEELK